MSITVCAILKETDKICIEFGSYLIETFRKPCFDILIVDNGISENARVYFEKIGVQLINGDSESFDSSRNIYLQKAEGDYILILDADERLRPEAIPQILSFTQNKPEAYVAKLPVYNYIGNGKWAEFDAVRLIKNNEGFHYDGREMHSQLLDKEENPAYDSAVFLFAPIHHYDCLIQGKSKFKRSRNIGKLQKMLKENPEDAISKMYLGLEYVAIHNFEEAEKIYKEALELRPHSFYIKYFYMLLLNMFEERDNETEKIARYLIDNNRYLNVSYSILAKIRGKTDPYEAIELLKEGLTKCESRSAFFWNLGYFYKDIDANLSYNYYIQALMWNPELFRLEVYQKADGPNLYECQNLIIENKSIFKLLENFAYSCSDIKGREYYQAYVNEIEKCSK